MPVFSTAQRLKIAIGGFVSLTGFIILITTILGASGAVNLEAIFQSQLAMSIIVAVAALDIFGGLLLVLKNQKISLSFASHQKKTNDNTDKSNKNP